VGGVDGLTDWEVVVAIGFDEGVKVDAASAGVLETSVGYLRSAYQDATRALDIARKGLANAQEREAVAEREFRMVRDAFFVVSPESDDRPQACEDVSGPGRY
jgi:hypothetical protein